MSWTRTMMAMEPIVMELTVMVVVAADQEAEETQEASRVCSSMPRWSIALNRSVRGKGTWRWGEEVEVQVDNVHWT